VEKPPSAGAQRAAFDNFLHVRNLKEKVYEKEMKEIFYQLNGTNTQTDNGSGR